MSEREIPTRHLPEDIVLDILSRLPAKYLLQFRCVSKQWRSIIEDGQLIKSHLSRSLLSPSHHRLLLPTSPLQSVNYYVSSDMTNASMELDCPLVSQDTLIKILGACNGLVCFITDNRNFVVYNPSTRHFKSVLAPQECGSALGMEFVYGFGCSSTSLEYRIYVLTRFARQSPIYPDVVLGQNDWQTRELIRNFDFIDEVGTFVNGALHWFACQNIGKIRFIASFDISEDAFKEICLPPHNHEFPYYNLGVLKGYLHMVCDTHGYMHVDIWVMKEYGVEKSWMKFIRIPRDIGNHFISYLVPLSFTKEGEVLVEVDLRDFVAYDTTKKTFRNVMVRGGPSWSGEAVVYVESLVSPNGGV